MDENQAFVAEAKLSDEDVKHAIRFYLQHTCWNYVTDENTEINHMLNEQNGEYAGCDVRCTMSIKEWEGRQQNDHATEINACAGTTTDLQREFQEGKTPGCQDCQMDQPAAGVLGDETSGRDQQPQPGDGRRIGDDLGSSLGDRGQGGAKHSDE